MDGRWYYLNKLGEGIEGAMKTGWFKDADGTWYYFNTKSDGYKGAMATGWYRTDDYGLQYFTETGAWTEKKVTSEMSSSSSGSGNSSADTSGDTDQDNNDQDNNDQDDTDQGDNGGSSDHDPEETLPDSHIVITLDTEETPLTEQGYYETDEDVVDLKGDIDSDAGISAASYEITYGKLLLSEGSLNVDDGAFTINDAALIDRYNTLKITVVDRRGTTAEQEFSIATDVIKNYVPDEEDSDNDGVENWVEDVYGTDKTKSDTDEDGLSDATELGRDNWEMGGYDALNPDADGDGVLDGDEDTDEDGLTDAQEIENGSHPYYPDSDVDGIGDLEEFERGLDPLSDDTDYDGLKDSKELEIGTDPLDADSDDNGIMDGDELTTVEISQMEMVDGDLYAPELTVHTKWRYADTISAKRDDPDKSIFTGREIPGFIGAAYNFESDGEIEEATMVFHFADSLEQSEEFQPALYYVDTENQEMTKLENQVVDWENYTVTAQTEHFSTYILLNEVEQIKRWEIKIRNHSGDLNARIDVVTVMDCSSSMNGNDPLITRREVARNYVECLREDDRAGLVLFSSGASLACPLTDNREDFYDSLDGIYSSGGTNINAGIRLAIDQFPDIRGNYSLYQEGILDDVATASNAYDKGAASYARFSVDDVATSSNADEEEPALDEEVIINDIATASNAIGVYDLNTEAANKMIILLSDGNGSCNNNLLEEAVELGITIYTVGLGNSYNETLLRRIADNTGGEFYHAETADDLVDEFRSIIDDTINYNLDTDADGLSDYHEERIRLFNGQIIVLNPNMADTDGDGLLDGQEVIQTTNANGDAYFKLRSLPYMIDSDFDNIDDADDKQPLIENLRKSYIFASEHVFANADAEKQILIDCFGYTDPNQVEIFKYDINTPYEGPGDYVNKYEPVFERYLAYDEFVSNWNSMNDNGMIDTVIIMAHGTNNVILAEITKRGPDGKVRNWYMDMCNLAEFDSGNSTFDRLDCKNIGLLYIRACSVAQVHTEITSINITDAFSMHSGAEFVVGADRSISGGRPTDDEGAISTRGSFLVYHQTENGLSSTRTLSQKRYTTPMLLSELGILREGEE